MQQITVDIITQEKHVLQDKADQISVPTTTGEVTILPNHIPLFTRLQEGILKLFNKGEVTEYAVMGGFMDVGPNNKITIMADSAIRADDINVAKAEEAKQKAEKALENKQSEVEFKQAEASLRKALLELKVARRKKQRQQPGQ